MQCFVTRLRIVCKQEADVEAVPAAAATATYPPAVLGSSVAATSPPPSAPHQPPPFVQDEQVSIGRYGGKRGVMADEQVLIGRYGGKRGLLADATVLPAHTLERLDVARWLDEMEVETGTGGQVSSAGEATTLALGDSGKGGALAGLPRDSNERDDAHDDSVGAFDLGDTSEDTAQAIGQSMACHTPARAPAGEVDEGQGVAWGDLLREMAFRTDALAPAEQ
jgi:hypothetical protein